MNERLIPRPEYPRPEFIRENNWINLNGEWNFAFDDSNQGLRERWYKKKSEDIFNKKIIVPFCFQSQLSQINDQNFHDIMWYQREFKLPKEFLGKRILLHFEAVDYSCMAYLNGEFIGSHQGGYTGFTLDITDYAEVQNNLIVRVEDPSEDLEIPRGKQYWKKELEGIFYPRISGIWETVWLESINRDHYIKSIKLSPDIDKSELTVDCDVYGLGFKELNLSSKVMFDNQNITELSINLDFLGKYGHKKDKQLVKEILPPVYKEFKPNPNQCKFKIKIPSQEIRLWDPDNPNLYDLKLKLVNSQTNETYDEITSYFGMRKISISGDNKNENSRQGLNRLVLLNNKPIYQKLFLVQGYWKDGLYTAPSEEAMIKDIQYVKDFGFNGLRAHQRVFSRRFLYLCDKMGILVWGEIGNAFRFSVKSQLRLINEFTEEILRDFNHPSIIVWTVLNEGWGVAGVKNTQERGNYTQSLYHFIKSIDPSRLVVDDDGWWHTKTDLCTKHVYLSPDFFPPSFEIEKKNQAHVVLDPYIKSYEYNNEPILYSEIGGYGFDFHEDLKDKWGYGKNLTSGEELFNSLLNLFKELDKRKEWIQGFCYTQLYDQYQEINGILTFDREPKINPNRLKQEIKNLFY